MTEILAPCPWRDARQSLDSPADPLRGALLESRQRWRDLVTMAADLAFETDAWGRFTFLAPDPALGWASGTLLGQPPSFCSPMAARASIRSDLLLPLSAGGPGSNARTEPGPV